MNRMTDAENMKNNMDRIKFISRPLISSKSEKVGEKN